MSQKWSKEWPVEKGYYWFYGRRFRDSEIKMHLVDVWKATKAMSSQYVTNGSFLSSLGADGVWQKAKLPTPPK